MSNTPDQNNHDRQKLALNTSLGMIFGAGLGLILGNQFGNIALGLIFGAGLGMIFGAAFARMHTRS